MSPFELSIFSIGLVVMSGVLVFLYLLVLTKLKPGTRGELNSSQNLSDSHDSKASSTVSKEQTPENPSFTLNEVLEKSIENPSVHNTESPQPTQSINARKTTISGCCHHFGYLGEHSKETSIPNECLLCLKIIECLKRK